jgi:predicted dithiol-disulfide oxidoreductase (DUF899 family)
MAVASGTGSSRRWGYYFLLDRTPVGRDEGGSQPFWLRRHDQYEDAAAGAIT